MPSPNRILMLLENNPYPQDLRVSGEASTLASAGYTVSVLCPANPGQARFEVLDGVNIYRYPMPPAADGVLGYFWEFGYSLVVMYVLSLWVLLRRGFDVIHAHNPPDVLVLIALLYKPFGKKFVFDHHDLSPEMYRARFTDGGSDSLHKALLFFEKLTYRTANHVIATNESYKQLAIERGGVAETNITVVRNGPNLKRLRILPPDPELRQKAPHIFGYVGIMGVQDGIDYLLRALHQLAYTLNRTDFYCVLIGYGDAMDSLKALTAELKLEPYVWFTGRISDGDRLSTLLSTCDICVDPDPFSPYADRSTMIKMMEYMALGKPIVAFDLTEHRFTAQNAALYVQNNDELAFAQALVRLMDDPTLCEQMGAAGRTRIEEALAWPFSAANLLRAYQTQLAKNGRDAST